MIVEKVVCDGDCVLDCDGVYETVEYVAAVADNYLLAETIDVDVGCGLHTDYHVY